MPDTEVTSDYSGSLTPTSSSDESEEEDTGTRSKQHLCETSALLWTGTGTKKCPLIIFRPESLISRERKLKAIGEKYHLSYKMVKTESKLVRSLLSAYGFHEVHPNSADFNLMWTGAHLKPFSLRSLQEFQKVNHFPRSYEITRKDRLYKNIERMAHTKGAKHFDFVPRSYLMPSEYQEFCAAFVKEKGSWIVKPIASSRGRGIYLINNPNQVPLEDNIMVCKYISNPLLIDGFKFDVRVYVAVTSYDPLLIYMFEEGLTRFATVKYEKTNRHLKNQMMHLTNYSINKKSHDYVRCEDPDVEDYGNKWSMSAMLRYLKQEGINTTELMMKMEAVIIKSILAAELPIATACRMFVPHRENCVELYGFDILVDENLKPWILEGNLSPSLACDAPLDLKIKSHMVSDFFSLAGFSCVDPLTRKQSKKQLDVMRRPYSASKGVSAPNAVSQSGPNKRPQSASTAPKDVARGSLSAEEAKVLKMAKEQYQRRGSFVRIFPTPETWEVYGSFLEYKSSLNHMLAQKLFPDMAFSSRPTSGAYSSAVARMRSVASSQMLEGRSRLASERSMQYERKLLSLESSKKRRLGFSEGRKKTKHKPTPIGYDNKSLAQGRLMNNENGEESDSGETCELEQSQKVKSSSSSTSKAKTTKQGLSSRSDKSNPSVLNQRVDASVSSPSVKQSVSPTSSSQRVYMYKTDGLKEMPKHHKKGASAGGTTSETSSTNLVKQENKLLEKSASASDLPDEEKDQLEKPHPAPPVAPPAVMVPSSRRSLHQTSAKKSVNVLEVLKCGGNLGKVQARQAFSSYLSRVQHRLMAESEKHSKDTTDLVLKQEEQMDLVLRFLKRAASNLRQTFSVIIPSRRLSLCDRKRILAKQLGDFVHIYNKETESMEHKQHMSYHKDNLSTGSLKGPESIIQDEDFRIFVSAASELALEEVLTAYTHKNKSASVFLGASRPKSANIRSPQSGRGFKENNAQDNYGANDMESRQLKLNMGSSTNWFHKNKIAEHILSPHSLTDEEALASGDVSSLKGIKSASHSGLHSANFHPQTSSMSSMQQAAYLYSAKLTPAKSNTSQRRPASAKVFTPSSGHLHANSSGRPLSASNRPLGGNLHYQTATNHEALVDALHRLSEKQAARQYSAPGQLSGLTNHLSTLNLSNLDTVQRNHPQLGGIGTTPHKAFPHKSSSLCDLASFDPSVQSMLDPGQHGKYSHMLTGASSVSKLPQESSFQPAQVLTEESNEQLQQSKAKHQAFIAQARSSKWNAPNSRSRPMRVKNNWLAGEPCSGQSRCSHKATHKKQKSGSDKTSTKNSSSHGLNKANVSELLSELELMRNVFSGLVEVGELPSKQWKQHHRGWIANATPKTCNPSSPSRSRLKERVKSDNNGAPLNLLTRPPSIPKPPDRSRLPDRTAPDRSRLPERTVPFRKPFSSPRLTSPARREPEIPDKSFNYYASLKYDNNIGATKLNEGIPRQTKPSTFTSQATDDKAAVSQLSNGGKPMWRP